MKRLLSILLIVGAVVCLMGTPSFALVVDLIGFNDGDWGAGESAGLNTERYTWTEVAEMEDIYSDSRITGGGVISTYSVGSSDWAKGMWIWGAPGWVQTAFTTPADSLFVQFQADSNDGPADFYLNGVLEYSLNTYNGSWFAVVFSDLPVATYTLKVVATSYGYPRDLAIDAMGSNAPTGGGGGGDESVPEPATLLLLGSGIFGFGLFRRMRGER